MNAPWIRILPGFLRDRLAGRHGLQAALGNSGWLFADKAVRMGGGLLVSIWIARYLGPGLFGKLSFALAFVALFGPIASLGLDAIVVRELVRDPTQAEEILGSAFFLKLAGALLAVIAVLGAMLAFSPEDMTTRALVAIIALGVLFQAADIADLWFQSRVQSRYTVLARNAAFSVLLAVKIALLLLGADVIAFAWAASAEIALAAVLLALAFRLKGKAWSSLRPRLARMRSLLAESWPLLLAGLTILVYMRIDQVMLAAMLGEREVGVYSAAVRLSEMWYAIATVIVSSVMPSLTDAHARSEALYYQRLRQLLALLARIAYLVAIPVSFLAGVLVQAIYGEAYASAGPVLAVHIWTGLFVFLSVGASPWIINERFTRLMIFQTSMGAVVNILLNLYLIPRHGALGAAVATAVSQAISCWLSNLCLTDGRKLFWLQTQALALGFRFR